MRSAIYTITPTWFASQIAICRALYSTMLSTPSFHYLQTSLKPKTCTKILMFWGFGWVRLYSCKLSKESAKYQHSQCVQEYPHYFRLYNSTKFLLESNNNNSKLIQYWNTNENLYKGSVNILCLVNPTKSHIETSLLITSSQVN